MVEIGRVCRVCHSTRSLHLRWSRSLFSLGLMCQTCDCKYPIDIPDWVPAAIAVSIALLSAIAVAIVYACQEAEKHRNFYGREDKLSHEEEEQNQKTKEDMEAIAYGKCTDEYTIQTPQTRTPGVPGVRVMVRRRHYRRTTPLDRTPRPGFLTKERIASPMCTAFKMQIKVDKTNRGEELLDLLGSGAFPYGKSRENADQMVEAVKDHLQRMTGRNFVVSGILNGRVIMKGQENLRDNVDEMTIKLKLAMMVPAPLVIIAYQIITESATENVERSPHEVKSDDLKREVTPLPSFDEKKSENPKKQRSCPTPMDVAPSQAETPAPMERASLQTRIKPEERTSLQNRPPRTDRKETLQANSTMRSEPRQPPTARSRIPENSRARIKSIKSDLDRRDHNRLSQEYSGLPSSAKKHGKTRHSGMEIMDMIPSSAKKHAKTRLSSVEPTEKESTHHAPTPNRLRSNKSAASSPATPRVKPTKQESEQIANAKQVTL